MLELIIGLTGMALILFAFLMNQSHKWEADWLVYDAVNFVGSALLITYSLLIKSWPFLILNAVWAVYSIKDVFLDLRKKDKSKAKLRHKRR